MKKKKLKWEQLGMMSTALMKGLFPQPTKTCILVDDPHNMKDDDHNLYFSDDYYAKLVTTIKQQISNGSYSKSNAESDWLNLANAIFEAEDFKENDGTRLAPHFLAK